MKEYRLDSFPRKLLMLKQSKPPNTAQSQCLVQELTLKYQLYFTTHPARMLPAPLISMNLSPRRDFKKNSSQKGRDPCLDHLPTPFRELTDPFLSYTGHHTYLCSYYTILWFVCVPHWTLSSLRAKVLSILFFFLSP
jgi:hypothetical protein